MKREFEVTVRSGHGSVVGHFCQTRRSLSRTVRTDGGCQLVKGHGVLEHPSDRTAGAAIEGDASGIIVVVDRLDQPVVVHGHRAEAGEKNAGAAACHTVGLDTEPGIDLNWPAGLNLDAPAVYPAVGENVADHGIATAGTTNGKRVG